MINKMITSGARHTSHVDTFTYNTKCVILHLIARHLLPMPTLCDVSMLRGDGPERPRGEFTDENHQRRLRKPTEVYALFEKRGLFADHQKDEESTWHPINVMREMQNEINMRQYGPVTNELIEQWSSWNESIRKIDTAYRILAYPYLVIQGIGLDIIHDDLESDRQLYGRDQVTLSDPELLILGRLITTHNNLIHFDSQRHTYKYSDVPIPTYINPYGKRHMTTEQIHSSLIKDPDLPSS
jgi:hypothetical protein